MAGAPALRRRLRRPARADPGGEAEVTEAQKWKRGEMAKLVELGLGDLAAPQGIVVENGTYYQGPCKVSGIVRSQEVSGGQLYLRLQALGTNNEGLLKYGTGAPGHEIRIHQCPRGCNQEEVGEGLVHAAQGRLKLEDSQEEGWASCLKAVAVDEPMDELGGLRARGLALAQAGGPPEGRVPVEKEKVDPGSSKDKKKKKEKKEKKSKGKDEEEDGAGVALDGSKPKAAAQKTARDLFSGTGMDPKEKVRNRVIKKARSYLRRKKDGKSSSSEEDSSSSSTSGLGESAGNEETLFAQGSKVRQVAEGFPGSLAAQALCQMRQALLQDIGDEDKPGVLKAVAGLYFKQAVMKKTNGPSQREAHTLATIIDLMVKSKPACALDVAIQRLKSIEATSSGSHWSVSQRLEILPAEVSTLSVGPELSAAQKEMHSDSKTQFLASLPGKGGKNSQKGKEESRKGPKGGGRGQGNKGDGKKKDSA